MELKLFQMRTVSIYKNKKNHRVITTKWKNVLIKISIMFNFSKTQNTLFN